VKERNGSHGCLTQIAELLKAIDSKQEFVENDQWHDQRSTQSIVI
jgi:hypothetical protein